MMAQWTRGGRGACIDTIRRVALVYTVDSMYIYI